MAVSDSPELRTIKKCTPQLETAVRGIDRDLVHFLNHGGFFDEDVADKILNPVTLWTEADKAGELVKCIRRRVKQDPPSYHVLLHRFKQSGNFYKPVVGILEAEFATQQRNNLSYLPHESSTLPGGPQLPNNSPNHATIPGSSAHLPNTSPRDMMTPGSSAGVRNTSPNDVVTPGRSPGAYLPTTSPTSGHSAQQVPTVPGGPTLDSQQVADMSHRAPPPTSFIPSSQPRAHQPSHPPQHARQTPQLTAPPFHNDPHTHAIAQLVAMGFADTALNAKLLQRHNNVVCDVVNELVQINYTRKAYFDVTSSHPPSQPHTPPQAYSPSRQHLDDPHTSGSPMMQLVAMGFADSALNAKLLQKHNNVVPDVVNELIQINYARNAVPSAHGTALPSIPHPPLHQATPPPASLALQPSTLALLHSASASGHPQGTSTIHGHHSGMMYTDSSQTGDVAGYETTPLVRSHPPTTHGHHPGATYTNGSHQQTRDAVGYQTQTIVADGPQTVEDAESGRDGSQYLGGGNGQLDTKPSMDNPILLDVIKKASPQWRQLGLRFGQAPAVLDNHWKKYMLDSHTCCECVFSDWINNGGHLPHHPLSWKGVYDVLVAIDHRGTANDMKAKLAG